MADRSGRTGNEAGGYGERRRVGLHSTQPNLPRPLGKIHLALPPFSPPAYISARTISGTAIIKITISNMITAKGNAPAKMSNRLISSLSSVLLMT